MQKESLQIYLTHDIDWIDPIHPYSILKTLHPQKKWLSTFQLFDKEIFLRQIEKMIQIESELGMKSIYLIGASKQSMRRYDIRYTPSTKPYLRLLKLLENHVVGLHSNAINLEMQLTTLENLLQKKILFHRSHFMKPLDEHKIDVLHHHGVRIDFSEGSIRTPKYSQENQVGNLRTIPTVLSDNAFFYHSPDFVFTQFKQIILEAKQTESAISLLFHPENSLLLKPYWEYYQEIIQLCKQEQALFINK